MLRYFALFALVLGLASSVYASVQVSGGAVEETPATMTRVARRGDHYVVVWRSQYLGA